MSQAFITCPQTGKPVYVGINTEWLQLTSITPAEQTIDCPECGHEHRWNKEEIILRADGAG
jgi:hypothetical protein